jgi:putative ABC transport system permease protein
MSFPLEPGSHVGMGGSFNAIGRLLPGATVDSARADLATISGRIEAQFPSYSRDWGVTVMPLLDATVRDVRPVLLLLFGGVAILLLIVAVNVANLMLLRGVQRQHEWATRLALGATNRQIAKQVLTEIAAITVVAAVVGVLIATWATRVFVTLVPPGVELPRVRAIGIDFRVVVFAVAVSSLSAAACALIGAIGSVWSGTDAVLRSGGRQARHFGSWNRLANALIVSEVALSVVLAASAVLLTRSVQALDRVDLGFRAEHTLTLRTTLAANRYRDDERVRAFGRALMQRIQTVPGVQTAGLANYLPLTGAGVAGTFDIEGRPTTRIQDQKGSWTSIVGGRYFEAMGIPLLRGRLPTDADTANRPVVVIDEALAERYWPAQDPIGAHVIWGRPDGQTIAAEIIGVVGSVRWQTTSRTPPPTTYWWFAALPTRDITVVIRTTNDPAAVTNAVTAQIRALDPNQPIADVRTMDAIVSADRARARFTMWLLGAFAGFAFLLAAIGLYGLVAFGASLRRRELAIRSALGARPRDVLVSAMRGGIWLVGVGVVTGLIAQRALGALLAGLLYGVSAFDPMSLGLVALLLAATGLAATYLPARRAARVDPITVLKAQ